MFFRDLKSSKIPHLCLNSFMKSPSTLDHLKSILALPFMVLIVIPSILYFFFSNQTFPKLGLPPFILPLIGIIVLITGLLLFIQAIILFIKIGKGTLAPWNPTRQLVVKSLYRYMRNPMITGVFFILLSESLLIQSTAIGIWCVSFFVINHVYFIFKEEPDLEKRFGEEYIEYKKHVPRWLPRIRGWRPED